MSQPYQRSRPPSCPSDLRLDHFLLGELEEQETASLRAHLDSCSHCTARLAAMDSEREQFGRQFGAWVPSKPRGRRFRWRLWPVLSLAAAAAAILLVVELRPERGGLPTIRGKGQSRLEFYVRHQGVVRRGSTGEAVLAGDALRFAYSSGAPGYLAVISLDGRGRATVYYPPQSTMIPIAAGDDILLPASTILDDAPGPEQIWGVFCRVPLDLEPIRARVEKTRRAPTLPDGCQIDATSIEKRTSR
ncbi:MAG TPA: zf-HC2 domain-containing protein [Polyangia bacterium]|nr:zf-HC2 domain-containing protein [Polyangia bacterium]